MFGQIRHENYGNNEDISWPINSDCQIVHIWSSLFKVSDMKAHFFAPFDKVTIDEMEYTGHRNVNQIVSANFTVYFYSSSSHTDDGFVLNWSCAELVWSEWTQASDGTCNQERRLINMGSNKTTFGVEAQALIGSTIEFREIIDSCGKLL